MPSARLAQKTAIISLHNTTRIYCVLSVEGIELYISYNTVELGYNVKKGTEYFVSL